MWTHAQQVTLPPVTRVKWSMSTTVIVLKFGIGIFVIIIANISSVSLDSPISQVFIESIWKLPEKSYWYNNFIDIVLTIVYNQNMLY